MFMFLRHWRSVAAAAALLGAGGCGVALNEREGIIRHDGVYVFHAPGISGDVPHDHYFARGLIRGGIQEVHFVVWATLLPGRNLSDAALHEREARRLVERVRGFKATSPEARVILTGHSGGARIVIRAAELLDVGEDLVEQVWILAPALSPEYDFGPALERVPRIVALSSEHDRLILGMGTTLFGTSDGHFGDAGGRIGFAFNHPRFEQWGYDPAWLEHRNSGDHLDLLNQRFALRVIAPAMLHYWPVEQQQGTRIDPPKVGSPSAIGEGRISTD
ncbi:MAG: hypothetical protein KJZ69_06580 [Phycisphaerales bacterium]|nr:hypothetical protein [Phycisphaerales bacterium]